MKIFPPIKKYTRKQWFTFISGIFTGAIIWLSHFGFEYWVIYDFFVKEGEIGKLVNIIWPYFGIPIGIIIGMKLVRKWNLYLRIVLFISIYCLPYVIIYIFQLQILVRPAMVLSGIGIGVVYGDIFLILQNYLAGDPKFNGRMSALGFCALGIIIVFATYLYEKVSLDSVKIAFILILIIIFFTLLLLGRDESEIVPQKFQTIRAFLKHPQNISSVSATLIIGFMLTLPYYTTMVIFEFDKQDYSRFIITIWVAIMISAFFVGWIIDLIGRRLGIIFGFGIQGFGFLILSFNDSPFILDYIFPIILGIGAAFSFTGLMTILFELPEPQYLQNSSRISYLFMAIGMFLGVMIPWLLSSTTEMTPEIVSILILFALLVAIIAIFQIRETLPSKSELQWRQSAVYLSVIYKTGVPIFSERLNPTRSTNIEDTEVIFAGVLTAISSILDEVSQDNKPLKVIEKEDFTVLIEEGEKVKVVLVSTQDLKALRTRMRKFCDEFENLFGIYLEKDQIDSRLFLPTGSLIKKYFQD